MQFLVRIKSHLPAEYPADKRERLLEGEQAKARQFHDSGALLRTWRLPLQNETITLWEAADALELHNWLMSLPGMLWADATVQLVIDRNQMA